MYLAIVPDQNHFNDTSKKFDKVSIYLFCIANLSKCPFTIYIFDVNIMQNNVGFIPVVSNFWTFFKPY